VRGRYAPDPGRALVGDRQGVGLDQGAPHPGGGLEAAGAQAAKTYVPLMTAPIVAQVARRLFRRELGLG